MTPLVCGDIHEQFGYFNSFLNKHPHIKIILQVGDLGFWPGINNNKIISPNTKIFWCPGNHENWEELKKLRDIEIFPNVFYMERGSILTLEDGRNVLFMGGAYSIDRSLRIERGNHYGWVTGTN
jgi:hypothetical protein